VTVLLTARAVAERLDVAPATILRWARQGNLPHIRLPSGAVRFRESDVEGRLAEWSSAGGVGGGVLSAVPRISEEEE
jgi:excisionase family DNA binding protein